MERLRSPRPDQDSGLETIGPLPTRSSLLELLEVVRAPGVVRTDVDALLRGLARPLAEDESPRARADFLLLLIESPDVRGMQGTGGRTVGAAAMQALLDLGYPYALEIPPETLPDVGFYSKGGAQEIPIAGLIATGTGLLAQLYHAMPAVLRLVERKGLVSLVGPLMLLGISLGPAALAVLGGWLRSRELQQFGRILMALTGSFWLIRFAAAIATSQPLSQPDTWLALVTGLSFLLGTALMRRPEWLAEDGPSRRDTPPEPRP